MAMSPGDIRVVDAVLTNVVQGHRNEDLVGESLFPRVYVKMPGGKIITFGDEDFLTYDTLRARGAPSEQVTFGYEGDPYVVDPHSLDGKVTKEDLRDASNGPGINLQMRTVSGVMNILLLGLEGEQAALARDMSRYDDDHKVDLSSAQWTDSANDPAADVNVGKDAISDTIVKEPNTLLLSGAAFNAAKNNANVKEQFKYTSSKSITAEMLATYFDIKKVVVGRARIKDPGTGVLRPVWGGDAMLAYVAPTTGVGGGAADHNVREPSYGYTYLMDGHPMAEPSYYDPRVKSFLYPVVFERIPVISGMNAGFLLKNCAPSAG